MVGKESQEQTILLTQELIQQNSLSGRESGAAGVLKTWLQRLDFDLVEVDVFGNVIASKKGANPGKRVHFDGHLDVVEVSNPEKWKYDPFSGKIIEGKIWGRGASDMKGPLAAVAIALGNLPREQFCGTLTLSGSVGEEKHEGLALEKVMQQTRPDFVVICEPNGAAIGIGQKGRAGIWVDVLGKPAHSSVPHLGENAIYRAMEVIERLRNMVLPKEELLGEGIMVLIDGISRPYPSRSTIPTGFYMHFDRRLMSMENEESIMNSLRDALDGIDNVDFGFQQVSYDTYTGNTLAGADFHPGWKIEVDSPWIMKAQEGLQMVGQNPELKAVKFCTNGSYSAGIAGVPTMIYGPSSGMLAHCKDEHIEIEELLGGLQGYWGLASALGNTLV
ncbi:MAG: YgeY family selenium metabolism-linked hydrolase [Anaerolineaceae bacterium]|nr:YgeY family selenium metabolism-linked hydrolase [Anaerolineaceae bacterium]